MVYADHFIATSTTASSTLPYIKGKDISLDNIYGNSSAGFDVHSNSGAKVSNFGAGGSTNTTFYGGVAFPASGLWSSTGTVLITGSTTLQNFTGLNATTSQATTTSFAISSLLSQLLTTNANGTTQGATVSSPLTFTSNTLACATCLTGNQNITLSGDVSGSGTTAITTTLATVNSNVGSFGGTNSIPSFTVNGKGLITAASANTPSIPASEITAGTFGSGNYTFPATLTVTGQSTLANASTTQIGSSNNAYLATAGGSVGVGTTVLNSNTSLTSKGPAIFGVYGGTTPVNYGISIGGSTSDYGVLGMNVGFGSASTRTYLASDAASWLDFSAGSLRVYTASSGTAGNAITGTERLTVTNTGNVGVGSSTPAATFAVSGDGYLTGRLGVGISSTASANVLAQFQKSTAGSGDSIAIGNSSNNTNSWAELGLYNDSGYGSRAQIYLTSSTFTGTDGAGTLAFYTNTASPLVWGTNGSEKLRLLSGGNFGVGTSSPTSAKLSVAGSEYVTGGIGAGVVEGTGGRITANSGFNIPYAASTTAIRLNGTTVFSVFDGTGVGTYNTFLGYAAGNPVNGTGSQSAALGAFALQNVTTGGGNLAIGYNSLAGDTTGSSNVGIGTNAGLNNITGSRNISIGVGASQLNGSATSTIAIGYGAAIGSGAYNAQNYVAIGESALASISTNSDRNTAIGYRAGYTNSNGTDNVYIGASAGANNTTGTGNIIIGSGADFAGSASYFMNIGNFLYASSTSAGNAFGTFGIGTSTPYARLSVKGAGTGTGVIFQTTDSSNAPKVTILDNGAVGIGTTSPNSLLSLGSSATTTIEIGSTSSTQGSCLQMYSPNKTAYAVYVSNAGTLTTKAGTCN